MRKESATPTATDGTVGGVTISHGDRIVFAKVDVTKRDLALYYEAAAPLMLPHIKSRPLSTLRCPDGPTAQCFFQKHWSTSNAPHVKVTPVREADGGTESYAVADSAADLIRLVQMNVIEIHPWASSARTLESPDRLILDLDPGPGISWTNLRESAVHVRDTLSAVGLRSWVKLSGGKGVHVVLPLERRLSWEQFPDFARLLASRLVADSSGTFVDKASVALRKKRIFIDWLRNSRGATAVAPWSVRARDGAPVATPLDWDDLARIDGASVMTVPVVMDYLAARPDDPWAELLTEKQRVSDKVLSSLSEGAGSASGRRSVGGKRSAPRARRRM